MSNNWSFHWDDDVTENKSELKWEAHHDQVQLTVLRLFFMICMIYTDREFNQLKFMEILDFVVTP